MKRLKGEALGIRITRAGQQPPAAALGRELARIHNIQPPQIGLSFLGRCPISRTGPIAKYRVYLDNCQNPTNSGTLRWWKNRAPTLCSTVQATEISGPETWCTRVHRLGFLIGNSLGGVTLRRHRLVCARCWRQRRSLSRRYCRARRIYDAYESSSGRG